MWWWIRCSGKFHKHNGETTIHSNKAVDIGGGAYVYQSDFTVQDSNCINFFTSNEAEQSGGGIHAISSLVTTSSGYEMTHLGIVNNTAIQGGGVYLEANSKFYVLKREPELNDISLKTMIKATMDCDTLQIQVM